MTPLQLQMLLHYHCIARPYGWNDPDHANSDAVNRQRRILVGGDMLVEMSGEIGYRLTERGKFFIEHICSLPSPEPVRGWKMPDAS